MWFLLPTPTFACRKTPPTLPYIKRTTGQDAQEVEVDKEEEEKEETRRGKKTNKNTTTTTIKSLNKES